MKKENYVIISFCILSAILNIFVLSLYRDRPVKVIKEIQVDYQQILENYQQRFAVCFNYNPNSGDYAFRHDYCRDAEMEYLEIFNRMKDTEKWKSLLLNN